MELNQQLLISYESVNAIGTTLELKSMVSTFLRTFSKKTGALVGVYWEMQDGEYVCICSKGKKSLVSCIKPEKSEEKIAVLSHKLNTSVLHVKVGDGVISFLFHCDESFLKTVLAILKSIRTKLENAIQACKIHEELIELNKNLEVGVRLEVEKNRKKDKHILQQSRLAQMGEMISMIAHQWRQPLGAISTVAAGIKIKLALKKFDLESPSGRADFLEFLDESLEKFEKYVNFLTNTIDDFRNFFKPDKKKDLVTLDELIIKTLHIIAKALEVNGIELKVEKKSTKELELYKNEITQVILNLLKNAEDIIKERKPEEKIIWIRTYDDENGSYLEVEDSAGGIDKSIKDKIFEPYFSTKAEKNGSGLGLYMCKIIVEEHCKGKIDMINTQNGALFKLAFKDLK